MESILKSSSKVKGLEILYFDYAEIEKFKGNTASFAASGPLSLLYFSDYGRFVLQLNDWRYPLISRLPILSQAGSGSSYVLPAQNGFFYRLRIPGQSQSHSKLDNILQNSSNFAAPGQEAPLRKLAASPDDKLARRPLKETGPKEVITQGLKQVGEKAKVMTQTIKTGTMGLTSKKAKVDLDKIKNKNFKREARSTFKKDFFDKNSQLSQGFLNLRRENANRQITDFKNLATINMPTLYVEKDEIEDLILSNKELAAHGTFNLGQFNAPEGEEKRGFLEILKHGMHEIKESISDFLNGGPADTSIGRSQAGQGPLESHGRGRNMAGVQQHTEPKFEGMTHYQG